MVQQELKLGLIAGILASLMACASPAPVKTAAEGTALVSAAEPATDPVADHLAAAKKKAGNHNFLICRASRRHFHYDWSAGALNSAASQGLVEQNDVRYVFRSAKKPAGERGENLKVGECGWAAEALAQQSVKRKKGRSQVVFKSLSDEATQTFYKMKTGKVFKVPVRQTSEGLVATPGGVSVIR